MCENKVKFELESATKLSDEILADGFTVLFGKEWKHRMRDSDKASEIRSIIKGSTMPCIPFLQWVSFIDYIRENVKFDGFIESIK